MSHPPSDPDAALREAVKTGNVVFVAGTGVSTSATFDPATKAGHPQASWIGLLKHGLDEAERMGQIKKGKADIYRAMLAEDPTTENLISTASTATKAFGGVNSGIFKDWLENTIGKVCATNRNILDPLHALREAGNFLATTNYDDVLLDYRIALQPITWMDGNDIVGVLKNRERDKIIYLHGYWKRPESVILDGRSYEQIARDDEYRDDLAALWKTTTWVYVGCSESGITDPDLGLLLERHGERARDAKHWDYCLVHKKDVSAFQKCFDDRKLNIVAVPYGDNHNALPVYLRSLLPASVAPVLVTTNPSPAPVPTTTGIPKPPAFYAEPDYIGSHKFVGRDSQLQELTDWANPADPTNLLLFEAIGGNGKSMLTWEWTTNPRHALAARPADKAWAGRFWYSFYKGGASMEDFCHHALAYMTGRPLEDFAKKKTAELKDELLAQLHARPWLLILDGLERILVAYHRIDAAEAPDEEANIPTDKIADRNPCDAIRDEDNDLLRSLAAAAPSKLLLSSRLTPRVLLNPSGQPIPGAKRITLPGLRPPDAEALLRSCGIKGKSDAIQGYLNANCDNHPLVIGILGGLIANYLPARGDFDTWSTASDGGAALDLASLDLIQRRNHILEAAIQNLPDASRQLLSTLALLTDSVDYETLKAFNPHLPPEPEEVAKPERPEKYWRWDSLSEEQKAEQKKQYEAAFARRQEYEKAVQARLASAEFRAAPKKLEATVKDLEQRGLLQWDGRTQRYDLHPVVRGVASGAMAAADRERHGQRVVDHFASVPEPQGDGPATLYIHQLSIENIRCFDRLELNFCTGKEARSLTMLLGDNAVGKTTILRCLALAMCDETSASSLMDDLEGNLLRYGSNEGRITVLCGARETDGDVWKLETRITRGRGDVLVLKQQNSRHVPLKRIFACAYGAFRGGFGTKSYERYEVRDSVRSLFDYTASLQNPELVVRRMEASGYDVAGVCNQMNKLLMLSEEATQIDASGISVEGPWQGRVPVSAIGDGYAATLAWLVDFFGWALFYEKRFLNSPISGIVILDEIEKHLHPRWQRHIIRQLCEQFPLVQFILTSHSPICAGGVADLNEGKGAIFVLSHNHEAPQQIETPAGWRYDQILTSSAFGLTSARDATTQLIIDQLRSSQDSLHRDADPEKAREEFQRILSQLESRSVTAAQDESDRQNRHQLAEELREVKSLLEGVK